MMMSTKVQKTMSNDKDIHLSSNVMREKVGNLPLNMCSILQKVQARYFVHICYLVFYL
jgi:hypothetical protein